MVPPVREPPPGELAGGRGSLACASLRLVRNPDERCLPFQCTDHAERWDSRREGTTSQLGVLPAARLRRAVPTRGRRSLACASLRLVRNPDERCPPFQCTDHAERWDFRRERTTSQLGVLPAARLRRAVPTRGRCSLACASLRLVRNPDERCLPFQCTDHAERWDFRRERTTSELGVLPAARLRRAVPAPTGRTGQRSAFPCLRVAPPGEKSGRTVSAIPMYGSRRTLGFPPRTNHLATGGPSRRPPSAGCAGPHRENWPEVGVPLPARRSAW